MHTRLTIPERLKDLRVAEKRMSLQELSDATGIPSSTLGNYEKDENVDMSLGNLLTLADFYQVSTDYLLCRTELREHTNKSVSDLHLNDDAVQILTDEKYNPRLLSELLSHESFHKFMTDLEIYIVGFNDKGIQIANAFLDVMRCKLNELGADSTDAFTSPTQIATEDTPEASNDAYINGLLLLFCKNLEMKITQLSVEEKQTLKEIFSRSKPAKEHRKLRRRNPKL
jgi:transcriptional regulator with XRE-family HTH domain